MFKKIILLFLLPTLIYADAVIFSGNDVKALKQNLDLFGVVKVLSGSLDPSAGGGVIAPIGSAYLSTAHGLFIKTGAGNTAWTKNALLPVDLATQVSGILATANGGTGSSNLGTGVVKASSGTLSTGTVDLTSNVNGVLPVANGGTNLSTTPTNGQLLIGNGTNYTLSGLTGTANRVSVTNGAGSITLSTPQDIATTSNVQFADLNATGTTTLNSGLTGPLKASSGVVSSSAINLASEVTGTLPIANGGTGSATQNFVDLTTNQTVAGEKTFSNTLKSDSIQTTGSSGVVIKNSSGTTVAEFGPTNTTNASIAGGLSTGGNIAATGTVTGSNLSGTNTGDLLGQAQSEGSASTITTLETPLDQLTTTDTNKRLIETGNDNVIKDPGFEGNSLQWVTYADAAGTAPVDGTGGTANVTVAYTTTSPLKGKKSMLFTKDAANRQGQGTSINFTIPDINKGKVNNIKISYDIASGTYATGDLTMWVINVDPASATNGRVIQPSAYTIENSGLKESKFLEFQSDIDSNLYRLVIHVTSTSASEYSLRFDEVEVSIGEKVYGSVTTDWVPYTPTITGFGTPTNIEFFYAKVGDTVHVKGSFLTGTNTAVEARVSLPSGMSSVATTISDTQAGEWVQNSSSAAYNRGVVWSTSGLSYVTFGVTSSGTSAGVSPGTHRNGDNFLNDTTINFNFKVPIAGWSSSRQLSNDADTRVNMTIVKNHASSYTAGNNYAFTEVVKDTHGSFNVSTGAYTIKTSGFFKVCALIQGTFSGNIASHVYVSGVQKFPTLAVSLSTELSTSGCMDVYGDAGQSITLRSSADVSSINSGSGMSITRISGPSQIAASETVSALYTGAPPTGTLGAAWNTVTFGTKVKDSHNAYSSGSYTVPSSGIYSISTGIAISATYSTNSQTGVAIYIDGVQRYMKYNYSGGAVTAEYPQLSVQAIPLLAGQVITIRSFTNGTSPTFESVESSNFFSIVRTGNY